MMKTPGEYQCVLCLTSDVRHKTPDNGRYKTLDIRQLKVAD